MVEKILPIKMNFLIKFIAGLIIFLSFFYIINFKMIDPDLGWHLKTGEWIFNNKLIPHFDEYSYTMPGFKWVDHEWLIDTWLWWMRSNNLWLIVVLIFSALTFCPFLIWLRRCKSLAELWLIILLAILMLDFTGTRPQIISFFLFFIVLEILYKSLNYNSSSSKKKIYLIILPVIFFIWANLHAGFFSGLVLFGLFIFISFLLEWRKNKNFNNSILKIYFPIFLISLSLTLINPYGWELYKEIFTVIFSSDTAKYINEWKSSLIASSVISFSLILGISLSLFKKYYKKYPLQILIIALFFFVMYLKSVRMGPLFFITIMPIMTLGIGFIKEEILSAQKKSPFNLKQLKIFKIISIFLFIFIIGLFGYTLKTYKSFYLPEKAVNFLKEYAKQENLQNILNDYGWGGYLIWKMPELKVFIDGRMPHWIDMNGNSAMKDYIKIYYSSDKEAWKNIFKKYKISTVIKAKSNCQARKSLNLISPKIKNYLSKYNNKFVQIIKNILRKSEKERIGTFLLENNWKIIYEDEITIIMYCNPKSCSLF